MKHTARFFTLSLFFFGFTMIGHLQAQTYTLRGHVRDAMAEESLVAANIRVVGTTRGTITNAEGEYHLALEPGQYMLIVSFLGYRPDTLRVVLDRPLLRDVALQPMAIQMQEVLVTNEDPAYGIMRKVIDNKSRWREMLKSYQCDAYTKQVMKVDTAIGSVSESYSTGYWVRGDTLREVVTQMRRTENISPRANPVGVGGIINFYDDEIQISGYRFVGPTAQNAFDYYDFKLLHSREAEGDLIYVIRMMPKSRVTPLFYGTISIAGDADAVAGVEVMPNEAFTFPFISELRFEYAQQFGLYEETFWMPFDIRLKGSFNVGIPGLTFPKLAVEQVSSIYEYRINAQVPDTMLVKPLRITTKGAEKFDSTFWAQLIVLPLTIEEVEAYRTLDSTQTLEKQMRPGGALSYLSWLSTSFLRYTDIHFNRVEGLFLGGRIEEDSVTASFKLVGEAGYGLSDKKMKVRVRAEYFLDTARSISFGGEAYRAVDRLLAEDILFAGSSSWIALFGKNDYDDYYYVEGWEIFGTVKPLSELLLRLSYSDERQTSAQVRTNFSILNRDKQYRSNPVIADGRSRSVTLAIDVGSRDPLTVAFLNRDFLHLQIERSSPSFFKSDYRFTRIGLRSEVHFKTYGGRLLFPPLLSVHVEGGTVFGELPIQREFALASQASSFASFGVLRGAHPRQYFGNRYALLSVEHNFRSTPFLALNIPFLYSRGIELIVTGSIARTWRNGISTLRDGVTNGWYYEAGMGLGKLFGLFRVDVTRRLSYTPSYFVTLGLSRFF